MTYIIVML